MANSELYKTNGNTVTVPKWLAGFIGSLLLSSILGLGGMGMGLSQAVATNAKDIAVIQSNRFTSSDAIQLLSTMPDMNDYDMIIASLNRIEARFERLHPAN